MQVKIMILIFKKNPFYVQNGEIGSFGHEITLEIFTKSSH